MLNQQAVADALNSDVPPRDAAERVTFATWAIVTGKSPGGIFNPLRSLSDEEAQKMAQRLSERAEGTITVDDVKKAQTIEELATTVREFLEAGELDGFVRTIRKAESDDQVPVYVFHAAGGSTVVYEPLLNRLPAGTPMIGLGARRGHHRGARRAVRAEAVGAQRLGRWQAKGKPFVLAGWSLGGALSYACAIGLEAGRCRRAVRRADRLRAPRRADPPDQGGDPQALGSLREVRGEDVQRARSPRSRTSSSRTLDDEGQVQFVLDMVSQSGVQIPGGIVEHQRTSYLDNRALDTVDIQPYDGHVVLYMADRYHDDAITFEPAYATRKPDGGWGEFASDLEVVAIGGEHIQAIDEPYIAKVGAHMSEAINRDPERRGAVAA